MNAALNNNEVSPKFLQKGSWIAVLAGLCARLIEAVPAFRTWYAASALSICLPNRLVPPEKAFAEHHADVCFIVANAARLFAALMSTAENASQAALRLLTNGAVVFCTNALRFSSMWGDGCGLYTDNWVGITGKSRCGRPNKKVRTGLSADTAERLVRALRLMIATRDTAAPGAETEERAREDLVERNPFAAQFVELRGMQALELLRYADSMVQDDSEPALQEIEQLQSLLARMAVIAPAAVSADRAAELVRRRQTAADVRPFVSSTGVSCSERTALDVYIARYLQASGVPEFSLRSREPFTFGGRARAPDAPTDAALALMQARAREEMIHCAHQEMSGGSQMQADMVMMATLFDPQSQKLVDHSFDIQLDDERFPSHAMHFRAASFNNALGQFVHKCVVPNSGGLAADRPFVTLYTRHTAIPCAATAAPQLATDIIYGEYDVAAAAATVHPAGTVLFYPRHVTPPRYSDTRVADVRSNVSKSCSTMWCLVFKPCPASLLPGAVPVGRVVASEGKRLSAADDESDALPFDADVLARFAALAEEGPCCGGQNPSMIKIVQFKNK